MILPTAECVTAVSRHSSGNPVGLKITLKLLLQEHSSAAAQDSQD